jgi:hypothetical protein
MLKLSDANSIDFSNNKQIIDILSNIAWGSHSQKEVTDDVTVLREAAVNARKGELFDEILQRSNEVLKTDDEFRETGFTLCYRYSFEDYTTTEKPYRDVFFQPSQFLKNQRLEVLSTEAIAVGFRGFKKAYKLFCDKMRKLNVTEDDCPVANPTDFPFQPVELDAGDWICSADGVHRETGNGSEVACRHPILPTERLVNIDTGEEKLRIAYSKGRLWREIIVGKKELFDASKVISLASVGVSVTTKTARTLSEYLCDIEAINYDAIPERESVSRLGYIGNDMFSPYVEGVVFDGDANYGTLYNAVTPHGSYEKWLETAQKCRNESLTAQIMLAASFSSVLINKIGGLCFFVHLWGIDSGTGKTVALMLAASVWGNPEIGTYPQTFNSTQVGLEKTAAFLNNLPLCVDELQLSKDSHGHSKFDVYQLAQGTGRTRGNKGGGVDATPTWSLCVLTTGESPIVSDNSGAGAVNRVIDIECKNPEKVIIDGRETSKAISRNYGFAGKKFVEALDDETVAEAQKLFDTYFRELSEGASTEKQAMAAATVMVADYLADKIIFKQGKHLTTAQIESFLKSKASVSAGERGYAFICDWVALNANKFMSHDDGNSGEIYGKIFEGYAYINSTVFRNALKNQGFDDRALLSWLKSNGLLKIKKSDRLTVYTSVYGIKAQYVIMRLPDEDDSVDFGTEDYVELL